MAVRVVDQPIQEFFGQQVAPQTSANLTTARRSLNMRRGFSELLIEPEVEVRIALCPKIVGFWWYDASLDKWNDLIKDGSILDSGRTGSSVFTLAAADFLYIGAIQRYGGGRFDLSAVVNGNASTLVCQFPDKGLGWTGVTIVDGTDTGAGFAQDGNVTIALAEMPSEAAWQANDLKALTDLASSPPNSRAYWLRFSSEALNQVEIQQFSVFHHDFAAVLATGGGVGIFREETEYTIDIHENVGAIEFINIAAAATTMNVTHIRR